MAILKSSTTNFYQPGFSNRPAAWLHQLGNALVFPCHYGVNQFVRAFDVFREGRNKEMDQFSGRWEALSRPVRLLAGLALMIVGAPFAMLGQLLKVTVAYFFKQPFVYLAVPKSNNTAQDKPLESLKTMTWNLAAMHSILRAANRTRPVASRMPEAVRFIKNMEEQPDVLAFQEVFTEKATRILVNGLKDEYPYIVHNVGRNTVGLNSGLMLLSKYPIESAKFETFNERRGQNALSQKGALCANIVLPSGQRAVVTNVHLEAGGGGHKTKKKQFEQTFALKETAEKEASHSEGAKNSKHPLSIFMGDTNTPFSFRDTQNTKQNQKNAKKNPQLERFREIFVTPENPDEAVTNTSLKDEKRILSQVESNTAQAAAEYPEKCSPLPDIFKRHISSIDYNYVCTEGNATGSLKLFSPSSYRVDRLYKAADISDHLPKRAIIRLQG